MSGTQAWVDFLSPHFDQFVFYPPVGVWGISSGWHEAIWVYFSIPPESLHSYSYHWSYAPGKGERSKLIHCTHSCSTIFTMEHTWSLRMEVKALCLEVGDCWCLLNIIVEIAIRKFSFYFTHICLFFVNCFVLCFVFCLFVLCVVCCCLSYLSPKDYC